MAIGIEFGAEHCLEGLKAPLIARETGLAVSDDSRGTLETLVKGPIGLWKKNQWQTRIENQFLVTRMLLDAIVRIHVSKTVAA